MIKLIRKVKQRRLDAALEALTNALANYPDGKITDLVGGNTINDLMNRAVNLGMDLGYTSEEIEKMLKSCRATSGASSSPEQPKRLNTQF